MWRGPILPKILTNFFTQLHSRQLHYLLLHLPPPTPHLPLHLHSILPSTNQIILTTPHPTPPFLPPPPPPIPKHTQHTILPLIQNITYFQTKETRKKNYVFRKRGHKNLS
ncbi:P-loop NTPase, partial [Staphylococcus epidermidis]|uniref:P-loop NTPase n=1 Tax=Staphylococcus epidermidis TaxID=1282 RepID=UPI0037D9E43F